ncbi:MAG: FtsQ-type POTRA domain-containing protein [Thermodesulfovibrionales bacterium]
MRKNKKTRKNVAVNRNKAERFIRAAKYFGFVVLPVFMVVAAIFMASGMKSAFLVRSVVITGNEHLTDEELKTMAGLAADDNLLTVSGRRISSKMMESPWIRSVAVRKEFPDRLLIHISEAEPFALLDMKGKLFIVDDRGTMLEELRNIAVPFLPVISSNPYQEKGAFQEAITLAKAIKNTGLLSGKDRIEIISHKPQEMSVNIDGIVVKVGEGEYEEKLARLSDIEQEIKSRNIPVDYIDLRFANRVLVSPVNEVVR